MQVFQHQQWRYTSATNLDKLNLPDWNLPGGALSPELLAILYTRGLRDEETAAAFLLPERYTPALPTELPNLERGIRLLGKLRPGDRVLIWGDFDVDGQTSTAMLVEGLTTLGMETSFHVPARQEGHHVSLERLEALVDLQQPHAVIFCDSGSSANQPIEFLKAHDILVIIADHHDIAAPFPRADALINPKLLHDSQHPLWHLSGAGVSYLLLEALFHSYGRKREAEAFLDLTALGLIADVMRQVDDVRYLIQRGLRIMQRTNRVGLRALAKQLNIDLLNVTSQDVAFSLAPALNAFGRLGSAADGIELLLSEETTRAQYLAGVAESLNQKRRLMTDQILTAALEMISDHPTLLEEWDVLVLHSQGWDGGILGPVASKLVDIYHKPVALIVEQENGIARGSVRSLDGYPVNEALKLVDDILLSYGGHDGAGGFAIHQDNLPMLRRRLSQAFDSVRLEVSRPTLPVEGILRLERITLDFALELQRLAPFGLGNEPPVFVTHDLQLRSVAKLGRDNQHRRLIVENEDGQRQHVFWWNSADMPLPEGIFDLAYTIAASSFEGELQLQLQLVDWQEVEAQPLSPRDTIEVVDLRDRENYQSALEEVYMKEIQPLVWADGFPTSSSPGVPFSSLAEAEVMVILSAPSDFGQFHRALNKVMPQRVYLIGVTPPVDTISEFIKLLLGLSGKVIADADGSVNIQKLMERLGQSDAVVRLGLEYLAAAGKLHVHFGERTRIEMAWGDGNVRDDKDVLEKRLRTAFAEVEAFRRYVGRADAEQLIRDVL